MGSAQWAGGATVSLGCVASDRKNFVPLRALVGALFLAAAGQRTSYAALRACAREARSGLRNRLVADGRALAKFAPRWTCWARGAGLRDRRGAITRADRDRSAAHAATTIVLSTRGAVRCPALSKVGGLWGATLAAGRWRRGRPSSTRRRSRGRTDRDRERERVAREKAPALRGARRCWGRAAARRALRR